MRYYIEELPFYHGSTISTDNDGFPEVLPFKLHYREEFDLYTQASNDYVLSNLEKVYRKGSLIEGSTSSESGSVYIDSFLAFVTSNFALPKNSKIFEIGFGKGAILSELKREGYHDLTGLEPGDHDNNHDTDLENIKIIRDFYPSKHINSRFDLIYHFGVLEHISDFIPFLENQIEQLNNGGIICFAVPNCEPFLREGDISILVHEHFNYFTTENLSIISEKLHLSLEQVELSYGMIFCKLSRKAGGKSEKNESLIDAGKTPDYFKLSCLNLEKKETFFKSFSDKESLALYVPGRAINDLFILKEFGFRLIDDSPEMAGKYLPTQKRKIESFSDLCLNPPSVVLIYSRTFGEKIREKCLSNEQLKQTKILILDDLVK